MNSSLPLPVSDLFPSRHGVSDDRHRVPPTHNSKRKDWVTDIETLSVLNPNLNMLEFGKEE